MVAANGLLTETRADGDVTTYVWENRQPMASYLATVNIGEFVVQSEETPAGLRIRNYFPPDAAADAEKMKDQIIRIRRTAGGTSPVVVGQVMTSNASDPSVFWASGAGRTTPPPSGGRPYLIPNGCPPRRRAAGSAAATTAAPRPRRLSVPHEPRGTFL